MKYLKPALLGCVLMLLTATAAGAHTLSAHKHSTRARIRDISLSATSISVGEAPWGVAADPKTGFVYVTNEDSDTVSVIKEMSKQVTATIDVGSDPQGVAVDPTTNTVYVTNFGDGTLSVIDGANDTVTDTIPSLGLDPNAVAVDPTTDTIFVSTYLSSTVVVINGSTNTVTAAIPVPNANLHDVVVNPVTGTVYASAYNLGYVALISESTDTVTGELTGICGPGGLASDSSTDLLWVTQNYCEGALVEYSSGESLGVADVISGLTLISGLTPTIGSAFVAALPGGDAFISVPSSNSVDVVSPMGHVVWKYTVGNEPEEIDVDPTTGNVYVANFESNTVSTFHW